MTTPMVSVIDLLNWQCGKRNIRFLYLASETSFKVTEENTNEENIVPLFLGADIFADTVIRSENHPRYHAKFAKKGLATKLVFSSDFRFHGLRVPCSSNSLWFYSIQGVFRVAFELYNKHDQLSVLESFQNLWKSRINDNLLKMTYNLSLREDVLNVQGTIEKPNTKPQSGLTSQNSHRLIQDQNPPVHDGFDIPHPISQDLSTDSSADHDYCSSSEPHNSTECSQPSPLTQKIHSLVKKVKLVMDKETDQTQTALKALDFADHWVGGHMDEKGVTNMVVSLLETHSPGSSIYSSPLLQAVAGWLGRQFCAANGSISHQVEGFKVRHIERITDLPPAEELAAELFPEAMRTLLVHWMGLSEEEALWKRHSEYPILLLILEFANHNLITGVAHVLYSSLICK